MIYAVVIGGTRRKSSVWRSWEACSLPVAAGVEERERGIFLLPAPWGA